MKIELNKIEMMKSILDKNNKKHTESTSLQKEQATEVILDILREIKKDFSDLIYIVNIFSLYPVDLPINISTDFKRLYFSPIRILKLVKKGRKEEIKFQLMHIVLHGLLGDNETIVTERQSKHLWLAQDQRVNDLCERLQIAGCSSERKFYMDQMRSNVPFMNCFGNYHLLKENKAVKKKAKAAQRLIASDNHFFWHPLYLRQVLGIDIMPDDEKSRVIKEWREVRNIIIAKGEGNKYVAGSVSLNEIDADEFTKYLKKDNASNLYGSESGNMYVEASVSAGKPIEYKKLIKDMLRQLESQKEMSDSIDPMLYQYGLDLYDNVPLVEPREDNEQLRLSTICIAIDTSGSCMGDKINKFLRETHGLINDMWEYLNDAEIIMFQCDSNIKKEERMGTKDVLTCETSKGHMRGFGGTSFVPVFERIDEISITEDKDIDLLIYFTDCMGEYPDNEPDYPTVFVTSKSDAEMCSGMQIPDWILLAIMED